MGDSTLGPHAGPRLFHAKGVTFPPGAVTNLGPYLATPIRRDGEENVGYVFFEVDEEVGLDGKKERMSYANWVNRCSGPIKS